jgi:hypothetical protein
MRNPLKIPSLTKLARLGHFIPASQAGRLAGPVFFVFSMSFLCSDLLAGWPVSLVMGQEREEAGQVNQRGESVSRDNLIQAQAQVNP